MVNIAKFIVSVVFCFIFAFLGSAVTLPSMSTWYAQLVKPIFNPPNFVFAPVWTILYLMMGISLYIVWNKGLEHENVYKAIKMFIVQVSLNFLWSFAFFGLHSPIVAFIVILMLWSSICLTIGYFNEISKPAALLLVPYIFWVNFALILNLFIVILN